VAGGGGWRRFRGQSNDLRSAFSSLTLSYFLIKIQIARPPSLQSVERLLARCSRHVAKEPAHASYSKLCELTTCANVTMDKCKCIALVYYMHMQKIPIIRALKYMPEDVCTTRGHSKSRPNDGMTEQPTEQQLANT